jgi:hypothetical protein
MTTKKAVVWEYHEYGSRIQRYLIADIEDVSEHVDLGNTHIYYFPGIKSTEELRELVPELENIEENNDIAKLENLFFDRNIEFGILNEVETPRNLICYDFNTKEICNLEDFETTQTYEYWDGSNWRLIWFDDSNPIIHEITYETDFVNIDKWDGSNWFFRHKFNHGRIHKVLDIDDTYIQDTYILYEYTQYQGDLPIITFIDTKEKDRLVAESE